MAKADALVEGLNLLKLRLNILGDQDFSGGIDTLKKITSNSPTFDFIATNATNSLDLPHLKYFKASFIRTIFILGHESEHVTKRISKLLKMLKMH